MMLLGFSAFVESNPQISPNRVWDIEACNLANLPFSASWVITWNVCDGIPWVVESSQTHLQRFQQSWPFLIWSVDTCIIKIRSSSFNKCLMGGHLLPNPMPCHSPMLKSVEISWDNLAMHNMKMYGKSGQPWWTYLDLWSYLIPLSSKEFEKI